MPSFFIQMTSLPLYMLISVGILVELYATRGFHLSLVEWTFDIGVSAPYLARCFDWWERFFLLSLTPDIIYMLPFLFLFSTWFKMSQLMGKILIEFIEIRVEASYSDIPVANHVTTSWTLDYVRCVSCFNGNINYSRNLRSWKMSSLTTWLHVELPFDRLSIAYLIETIGSPSTFLIFILNESK